MNEVTLENAAKPKTAKILLIILVIAICLIIGLVTVVAILTPDENQEIAAQPTTTPQVTVQVTATNVPQEEIMNSWMFDGNKWSSNETPQECPDPLTIAAPADIDTATNILYPGQVRSGDFKPHGGFRFDENDDNEVTVTVPMDSILYRGSRYIEAGEVQYMLDFIAPCGIMFRFDHLLVLSERTAALVENLPAAEVDNSQTTNFSEPEFFTAGEEIAVEIGFKNTSNVAFDFGMYDLRDQNEASMDPTWANNYQNKKETAFFGVCWLDYLVSQDKSIALGLPGSGTEGKVSDYCK